MQRLFCLISSSQQLRDDPGNLYLVSLSVCLSLCLTCLSVFCLSVSVFVCFYIYLGLSVCLADCLSVCLSGSAFLVSLLATQLLLLT